MPAEIKTKVRPDLKYSGPKRNILIFLDGTWNDEDGTETDGATTNIYRMFRALEGVLDERDVPHKIIGQTQIGLYFRGVGNDEENTSKLARHYGGIFGAGEKAIRDHAYVRLAEHYRKGDNILIFGFSRGAACARLLASKIEKHGIPARLVIHSHRKKNRKKVETVFLKYSSKSNVSEKVKVRFLGLFDTVGAFGVPIDLGPFKLQKLNLFRDLTVSSCVQNGVHLVAIDESREPFAPTLVNERANFDEVWFPGVHSDVGGGYKANELGKITADFMLTRLDGATKMLPVSFDKSTRSEISNFDLRQSDFYMHYHGDGIKKSPRPIQVLRNDELSSGRPKVHRSVQWLIDAENLRLAEEYESFTRAPKIIYSPTNFERLSSFKFVDS